MRTTFATLFTFLFTLLSVASARPSLRRASLRSINLDKSSSLEKRFNDPIGCGPKATYPGTTGGSDAYKECNAGAQRAYQCCLSSGPYAAGSVGATACYRDLQDNYGKKCMTMASVDCTTNYPTITGYQSCCHSVYATVKPGKEKGIDACTPGSRA